MAIKYKYCRQIGNNKVLPHSDAQFFPKPFLPAGIRQCLCDLPSNKREVHRAEEAGEEKLLNAFPPSSSLHLKDFKAPNVLLTTFCPNLRGSFSYTFIRNVLLQTTQERGLTWLPRSDPGRIPPLPSDKKKPPKIP